MSMRLIYGRAGTGKSQFILNEIKTLTKNNLSQKIFIIVPEQFSYVTEKRLIESLDTNASINAEVISFKRLANRVFTEVGGLTKTNLTKAGKTMLVEYILEKNKKKLNFIGKSDDKDLILRTITELKKHSISNKMLEEQVDKTENQYLKLKLVDISKVYTLYEESIKNNYIDEDDILTILGDKIKYSNIFDESIIYIDEFSGFTEQEYKIISEILKIKPETKIIVVSSLTSTTKLKKKKTLLLDTNSFITTLNNIKNKTKRYAVSKHLLSSYLLYLKETNNSNITLSHPGIAVTKLFDKKNKAYNKLFYIFVPSIMKLIFMDSAKASLSILKALDCDYTPLKSWIGPRGLFHSWGYPKIYNLKKNLLNLDENREIYNLTNTINSK